MESTPVPLSTSIPGSQLMRNVGYGDRQMNWECSDPYSIIEVELKKGYYARAYAMPTHLCFLGAHEGDFL